MAILRHWMALRIKPKKMNCFISPAYLLSRKTFYKITLPWRLKLSADSWVWESKSRIIIIFHVNSPVINSNGNEKSEEKTENINYFKLSFCFEIPEAIILLKTLPTPTIGSFLIALFWSLVIIVQIAIFFDKRGNFQRWTTEKASPIWGDKSSVKPY